MANSLPSMSIVFWTQWFNAIMFDGNDQVFSNDDCPIPDDYKMESPKEWCTITPSTDHVDTAAAIVFHAADYYPTQVPAHIKNQPWILETQESPLTAPFRMESEKMKVFDYLASYHLKSAYIFSYYSPAIFDVVNRPLPMDFMTVQKKKHKAPIVWIARNCGASSGRQHYVEQLMQYIDVDSYGDCLNNKPFPKGKDRLQLMSEYKFYLAIENANCDDYVTEKLFDTISVSTVPIVDGPTSYQGFIPDKNSVIRMDAFPDPRELAKYINYLDSNNTAYLEHLAFRRDALDIPTRDRLDSEFINNWSDPSIHNIKSNWCSLCRGILPWWQARLTNPGDDDEDDSAVSPILNEKEHDNLLLVDKSCMEPGKWDYAQKGPPYTPNWKKSTHPLTLLHEHKSPVEEFLSLEHSDAHTAHIVWTIELIVGVLFMAFAAFVVYRGRFLRSQHSQRMKKPEIPLSTP